MKKLALSLCLALTACSAWKTGEPIHVENAPALRPMTKQEALRDFGVLTDYVRAFYGPLEYKEARFGFDFDSIVRQTEEQIREAYRQEAGEAEIMGLYMKFLAKLQDGHVGLRLTSGPAVASYGAPIYITPFGDKVAIAEISKDLLETRLSVGDEVLEIDGLPVWDYLPLIRQYHTVGSLESDKHFIAKALNRDFFMTELKPVKNTVNVKVRKATGLTVNEELVWKLRPPAAREDRFVVDGPNFTATKLAELEDPEFTGSQMGQVKPFFATKQVIDKFGFRVVTIDEEHRKKYGLKEEEKFDIYGALYRYQGKTILLVRSYTYQHGRPGSPAPDNLRYVQAYKAIFDQWEDLADVLVLDQTHNGGGSYCELFFRLFIQSEKNGAVLFANPDRKWIGSLRTEWIAEDPKLATIYKSMASIIEAAYDKGETLTEALPAFGGYKKVQPLDYVWRKPMLVLIDELSMSCADAFPMLVKNNGVAKLFGSRTAGLGGNVEPMETLPYSGASLRLTRSLFTSYRDDGVYEPAVLAENNGAEPDYPYDHSIEDFRAGYTGFVEAFSRKALEQIP